MYLTAQRIVLDIDERGSQRKGILNPTTHHRFINETSRHHQHQSAGSFLSFFLPSSFHSLPSIMLLLIGRSGVLTKFIVTILIISSADSWTFDYDDQEPVLEPESSSDLNNFNTLPKTDQPDFTDPTIHRFNPPQTDPDAPSTPTSDQDKKGNQPIDDHEKPIDGHERPIDDHERPIDDHGQERPILPIFGSAEKIEEGRRRYEVIKSEAPKYGVCWTNAIQSLYVGCSRLNDDSQARMGLSFANCFLEKVGSRTYPCSIDIEIKSCVRSMDDRAFNTYTHFYTHTQSICFFLANQMWQEATSDVVERLSHTSARVSDQLVQLQGMQEESIKRQGILNEEMRVSQGRLDSLGDALKEKQLIETEILARFMDVKGFILSEVSRVYSLGFYLFSIISVYLITTPVPTNPARFWILILFAANLAVERYIVSHALSPPDSSRPIHDVSGRIDELTWVCRKGTCIISALVIFIFWITYKDYGQLNHVLLSQVHHQQKDLIRSASEMKSLQFLQLQRMGLNPIAHHEVCPSHSGQESDSDLCEMEPVRHVDIMSDFSDLDSGHEEGPSDTESGARMKPAVKRTKKDRMAVVDLDAVSNGQPVQKVSQKSNQVIYSPTTTYKLRERKPRPATPSSQVRTKVVPKVEPATPTKRLEFSDDE